MTHKRVRVFVTGRVQGVYFRQSTAKEAQRLGLLGWVRNLPDGRVEALAQGPPEAVDALIAWCHRGPPAADVSQVRVQDDASGEALSSFAVRRA